MKQFIFFNQTTDRIGRANSVSDFKDAHIAGWMEGRNRFEDMILDEWSRLARPGMVFSHRDGLAVCVRSAGVPRGTIIRRIARRLGV